MQALSRFGRVSMALAKPRAFEQLPFYENAARVRHRIAFGKEPRHADRAVRTQPLQRWRKNGMKVQPTLSSHHSCNSRDTRRR